MISSREAQRTNHGTFTFLLPDPTDIDDVHLFTAAPPPQMRPDTERRPVYTDSILCKNAEAHLNTLLISWRNPGPTGHRLPLLLIIVTCIR